ncbi:MAG: flippase-like domain-containing protein [Sedimentisphaerales bacterium]|nr:flippase-like domain-containing protein [Sedimentisphaerales bacterium]
MFKSKRGKFISYILRFAVAGGALYLLFRNQDPVETAKRLIDISPLIIFAAFCTWLASQAIFVSRWLLLLRVQSIKISYWVAFRLHLLGIFYNICLPSAVGGDFIRAGYVTTHTDKKIEAALSVFVDRFVGVTSMILMAGICYFFIPIKGQVPATSEQVEQKQDLFTVLQNYWWLGAIILGVIILVIAAFLINAKWRRLLFKALFFLWHKGLIILKRIHRAMLIYGNHKIAFIFAYFLSFACQGIFIIGMWLVGRDLGIDCPAKYYFVFFPIAWMVGVIPISVGGIGVWEGVLIFFFVSVSVGLDKDIITTKANDLALFHRALWLFGSLPGIVIHLCGAHLPKDFSVDYSEVES